MIKDGIPVRGYLYMKRIPIAEVPVDDEDKITKFLFDMYERKVRIIFSTLNFRIIKINFQDKIFEELIETGELKSNKLVEKVEIKNNKYDLYIVLTWIILLLPISTIYIAQALWFGSFNIKLTFLIIMSSSSFKKFIFNPI